MEAEPQFKVGDQVCVKGGTVAYPVVDVRKRTAGWAYHIRTRSGAIMRLAASHLELVEPAPAEDAA